MLTPPPPAELVRALDDVLQDVCAPAVQGDFDRAQVLSASSIANYVAAELEQGARLEAACRSTAEDALWRAAAMVRPRHPDAAVRITDGLARDGDYAVAEALSSACSTLRSLDGEGAALAIVRGALAEIVEREAAVLASAERTNRRPPQRKEAA